MIEVSQEILEEIKAYIESSEVAIDGEWGSGRDLSELINDEEMPDIWHKTNKILEDVI